MISASRRACPDSPPKTFYSKFMCRPTRNIFVCAKMQFLITVGLHYFLSFDMLWLLFAENNSNTAIHF